MQKTLSLLQEAGQVPGAMQYLLQLLEPSPEAETKVRRGTRVGIVSAALVLVVLCKVEVILDWCLQDLVFSLLQSLRAPAGISRCRGEMGKRSFTLERETRSPLEQVWVQGDDGSSHAWCLKLFWQSQHLPGKG